MTIILLQTAIFVLIAWTRPLLACTNYQNVENAIVFSYTELSDAISCCVSNLGVSADIYVDDEVYITDCTMSLYGVGIVALTAGDSRIFHVLNSTLHISDIALNGGSIGSNDGAGMIISESLVTLNGVSIAGGRASSGGAIYIDDSTVTVISSNITENTATVFGGAIQCVSHGVLVLLDVTVLDNSAQSGGSIAAESCVITISNSLLSNGHAKQYGGCLYTSNSTAMLSNTTLLNCVVDTSKTGLEEDSQGGCMYATENSNVNISVCVFSNCSASLAAILKLSASEGSVYHSLFKDSVTSNSNIDLVGQRTSVFFVACSFRHNRANMATSVLRCGLGATCRFSDSLFEENDAQFSAAVTIDYMAAGGFSNCTFRSNSAGSSGGAVAMSFAATVDFVNCKFMDNIASQFGGGVYVDGKSVATFMSCLFSGNKASSGGALNIEFYSTLLLNHSTFIKNTADGEGGSVALYDFSSAIVDTSIFVKSSAVYGAALYVASKSVLTLRHVDISEASATYEGGCVAAYEYSTVIADSCTLIGNRAVYGGALFGQLYTLITVANSEIHQNYADYTGGAIVAQDSSTLNITNSTFLDNTAKFYGSVVSAIFSVVSLDDIMAENNECSSAGGVLQVIFTDLIIRNSRLISNRADKGGGFACLTNSSCVSQSNTYIGNKADFGGAVYIHESAWVSEFDHFIDNIAVSAGGAAYGSTFLLVQVLGAHMRSCRGYAGGAVSMVEGKYITIEESSFLLNTADALGGAIFLEAVGRSEVLLCNFSHNSAGSDGGGMALVGTATALNTGRAADSAAYATIANCRFVENRGNSTGGGVYGSDVEVVVIDSTFEFNRATYGAAFSSVQTAANISYSDFLNNSASVGGGGVYWIYKKRGALVYVDDATCLDYGNTAVYGSFKATDTTRLHAARFSNSKENSGSQIQDPIYVYMQDFYNQVVIDNTTSIIYSSTADAVSSIQGSTIEGTTDGVATFGEITVSYQPNSNVTLLFNMSSDVEADVEGGVYVLSFRSCIVGEKKESQLQGQTVCVECGENMYSLKLGATECKDCPENADCKGGSNIDVKPGYWRVSMSSDDVLLCPNKDACKGGDNTTTQCKHGHRGMYCSVCKDGYYNRAGKCKSCKSSDPDLLYTILPTILIGLGLVGYYLWYNRDRIRDYLSDKVVEAADKADEYRFGAVKTKFKIILAFVQIINQIPFVLNVDFPYTYVQFLEILWVFNLDFVEFLNFDCLYYRNFYDKLVTATVGPFVIVGVLASVLYVRHCISYRQNSINPSYPLKQFRTDAIFFSLLISFIVFSPVSIKILQTFACERFDDGSIRLIADYSIECSGQEYNQYVAYSAVMTAVYPIGVPMMYLALLWSFHDQVNPRSKLVVRDDERHLVSSSVIQEQKIKLRHTYQEIKIIAFLYETYEPQRWYFEVGDCFRRLMLTAVPVLIMRGTSTQIILVLCVSLACVAAYMELKPFITESDNLVAVVTQWAITLTLVVAIMIRVDEERGPNRAILGFMAILINSLVFVLTIVLVFITDDDSEDLIEKVKEDRYSRRRAKTLENKQKLSSFVRNVDEQAARSQADSDDDEGADGGDDRSGARRPSSHTEGGSRSTIKKIESDGNSPARVSKNKRGSVSAGGLLAAPAGSPVAPSTKHRKRSSAADVQPSRRGSVKTTSRCTVGADDDEDYASNSDRRKSTSTLERKVPKRSSFLDMLSTRTTSVERQKDSDDEADSDDDEGDIITTANPIGPTRTLSISRVDGQRNAPPLPPTFSAHDL